MRRGGALRLIAAVVVSGGTTFATATPPPPPSPIGVATREADGTIVLHLRGINHGGAIAEELFRYPTSDPHYTEIVRHVGPIPEGGSVPVAPFPDSRSGGDRPHAAFAGNR